MLILLLRNNYVIVTKHKTYRKRKDSHWLQQLRFVQLELDKSEWQISIRHKQWRRYQFRLGRCFGSTIQRM